MTTSISTQDTGKAVAKRAPLTQDELETMIRAVAATDADVARAVDQVGIPATRHSPQGFESFVRAVTAQQVSVQSARAIFAKVQNGLGGDCSPASILLQNEDSLRAMGLSRPKARYILGMAQAAEEGTFRPNDLPNMTDDDAVAHIVALKGFGQWSAEIYLLFSEGRGDMFPAGDLAVQRGYQRLRGLPETPKEKQLRSMTENWAPYRGAMAIFLWHLYGAATFD